MRILEISPESSSRTGIGKLVNILVEGLRESGHEVKVNVPRHRFREFKISAIPFTTLGRYDVVHAHGPSPFLTDILSLRNISIPFVFTWHTEIDYKFSQLFRIYRSFHRSWISRADAIITLTNDYAMLFTRTRAKVEVIPPPLTIPWDRMSSSPPSKNEEFTVLFVGQLRPYKGVEVLIRAAKRLRRFQFNIVGDGWLRSRLISIASDNVRFFGSLAVEDLIELYASSHVICLPSINGTEGFGLVLLEGSIFGCVPVASNLLGVRENVKRLRGYLFKPGDNEELTNILEHLCRREIWKYRSEVTRNAAREYALANTPERYVKRHLEVFKTVVKASYMVGESITDQKSC